MHTQTQDQRIPVNLGRFTRAAIHSEAGELELRLNQRGNWQLYLRADGDRDWRLACSGDLQAGAVAPPPRPSLSRMQFDRLVVDPGGRRALIDDVPLKLSGETSRRTARADRARVKAPRQPSKIVGR
jgi:hypothetical protein